MEYNDFYKNARAISQLDPDVNEDQQNQIANTLKDMKQEYLSTDDKIQKGKLNEKILGFYNAIIQGETFIYETSDAIADTNTFSKHSYDTLNPDVKAVLPDILNKKTYPIIKGGKTGYEVNGNFMTLGQIQDEVQKARIDKSSINKYNVLLTDVIKNASKIESSEFSDFNFKKTRANVYDNLVTQGNAKSMANNPLIGNRVFKDDLEKEIVKGTYKDFGITDDMIVDPTPADNKITDEDAKIIYKAIEQDEELLTNALADYLTQNLADNHYTNLKPEVQKNRMIEQQKRIQPNMPMKQPTPPSETLGKYTTVEDDPYEFMR
tara:strand:- start:8780 stop:9742 length:963 start_codon:yes stop_codon:yes gene_type:complete